MSRVCDDEACEAPRHCECGTCIHVPCDVLCADCRIDVEAWRQEYAMQMGMGLGIDAYNDAHGVGYDYDDDGRGRP